MIFDEAALTGGLIFCQLHKPSVSNLLFAAPIFFRVAICLLVLFSFHSSLPSRTYAQSATATLSGSVSDQDGAVIPGVNIAVISIAQGFQRSATTSDEGIFVVPLLPPGNYTVKAEHEGFNPAEVRDLILNVNDQKTIRISLKVGDLTGQTVDVLDTPPLLDESPTVGTTVDRQFCREPAVKWPKLSIIDYACARGCCDSGQQFQPRAI